MTDPRPLVVAEQPTPSSDPELPLRGDSGARLARAVGASLEELLRPVEVVNLVERWVEPWPREEARQNAALLAEYALGEGRRVVLLGSRVTAAFNATESCPGVCQWYALASGLEVATIPPLSEKSRWWREEKNRKLARRFWRRMLADVRRAQRGDRPAPPRALQEPRPLYEVEWLLDRLTSAYVQSRSGDQAIRAVEELHAQACEEGRVLRQSGATWVPTRPVSRGRLRGLLDRVRARWRSATSSRQEELRLEHREAIAADLARARKEDPCCALIGVLSKLLAEIDGVVGRPEERAASLQVSVHSAGPTAVAVGDLARMTDAQLLAEEQELDRALGPGTVVDSAP